MTGERPPETPQPQFKGVWICAEIWEHPNLTYAEKFLIAEIDSLSGKGKACFASNEFLANRILQKVSAANNLLSSLTTRGFLIRLHFDGRKTKRCVHPDISSNPRAVKSLLKAYGVAEPALEQPSVKSESSFQDLREESKKQPSSKSETESTSIETQQRTKKTRVREKSTPAKRHVRRGSRTEASSSFSLALPGIEEGEGSHQAIPMSPIGVDPLLEEFGPFTATQHQYIADYFEKDANYVQRQAAIVRSKPRENAAQSFMAALRDDWQPAKVISKAKPATKQKKPAESESENQEPELSFEERQELMRKLKADMAR
jgi:hypothetical protein